MNWFLEKGKKIDKGGYSELNLFFDTTNHRVTFDTIRLDEIKRCITYFDSKRIALILKSKPEKLISKEKKDFETFASKNIKDEEKQIRGLLISYLFNYESFRDKSKGYDAYTLTQNLAVDSCLYCNRLYANTVMQGKDKIVRPELDHFFPQHKYPYFALSFYNLIPSCHPCNSNLKGGEEFKLTTHLHPYLDNFDNHRVIFARVPINGTAFYPSKKSNFRIELNTSHVKPEEKKQLDGNIKTFGLNEIYSSHVLLVEQLKDLQKYSNKTYLDSIRTKVFLKRDKKTPRFSNIDIIYQIVMLNYFKPEDYYKRPMAKFMKDIAEDLGLI